MERKYSKRWVNSKTSYDDWDDDADDDEYSEEEEQNKSVPPIPHNILQSFDSSDANKYDLSPSVINSKESKDIHEENSKVMKSSHSQSDALGQSPPKVADDSIVSVTENPGSRVMEESNNDMRNTYDSVENNSPIPEIRISSASNRNSMIQSQEIGKSTQTNKDLDDANYVKEAIPEDFQAPEIVANASQSHFENTIPGDFVHGTIPLNSDNMHENFPVQLSAGTTITDSQKGIIAESTDAQNGASSLMDLSNIRAANNVAEIVVDPLLSSHNAFEDISSVSPLLDKKFQSVYDDYDYDVESDDKDDLDNIIEEELVDSVGNVSPAFKYPIKESILKEEYISHDDPIEANATSNDANDANKQESFNPYNIAKNYSENNLDNPKSENSYDAKQFSHSLGQYADTGYDGSVNESIDNSIESSNPDVNDHRGNKGNLEHATQNVYGKKIDDSAGIVQNLDGNNFKDSQYENESDSFSPLNIRSSSKLQSSRIVSDPISIDSQRPTSSHDLDKNFDDLFEDFENLSFVKNNQFNNSGTYFADRDVDMKQVCVAKPFIDDTIAESHELPIEESMQSISKFDSEDNQNVVTEPTIHTFDKDSIQYMAGNFSNENPTTASTSSSSAKYVPYSRPTSAGNHISESRPSSSGIQLSDSRPSSSGIQLSDSRPSSSGIQGHAVLPNIGVPSSTLSYSNTQPTNLSAEQSTKQSIGRYAAILDDDDSDSDSDSEFRGSVSMGAWGKADSNNADSENDRSITESIDLNMDHAQESEAVDQIEPIPIPASANDLKFPIELPSDQDNVMNIQSAQNIAPNLQHSFESTQLKAAHDSPEVKLNEEYSFDDSNADTSADVFGSSLHSISEHNSIDFRSSIYRNEFVQKTGAIHNSEVFDSSKINPAALKDASKHQIGESSVESTSANVSPSLVDTDKANFSPSNLERKASTSPEIIPSFARSETNASSISAKSSRRNSRILGRSNSGLSRRGSVKSIGISGPNRVNSIIEVSSSDEEPDELSVSNGIWGSNAHADSLFKVSEDIEKEFESLDPNSASNSIPVEKNDLNTQGEKVEDNLVPSNNASKRISELVSLNTNTNFSDRASTQESCVSGSSNVPNTPIAKSISEFDATTANEAASPSTPNNNHVPPTPKKDAKYESGVRDCSPAVPPKDNDFTPTKFAPVKHNIPQLLSNPTDQVHDMLRKVRVDEYKHDTGLHVWLEATLKSTNLDRNNLAQLGPIAKASFDEAANKKQMHVRIGEPQRRMSLNSKLNVSGRRFLIGTKNVNRNVKEKFEGGFARGLFKRNK